MSDERTIREVIRAWRENLSKVSSCEDYADEVEILKAVGDALEDLPEGVYMRTAVAVTIYALTCGLLTDTEALTKLAHVCLEDEQVPKTGGLH